MAATFDTVKFSKGVAAEFRRIEVEAARAVRAAGEDAESTAKSLARRDSGAMADSIKATPGRDSQGPYTDLTVDPYYSSWQEFGSSESPAKPFIRPATKSAAAKHLRRKS